MTTATYLCILFNNYFKPEGLSDFLKLAKLLLVQYIYKEMFWKRLTTCDMPLSLSSQFDKMLEKVVF